MPPSSSRVLRRARSAAGQLLHGRRHLLALRLATGGLVDREWYALQSGRRWGSDLAAALHYVHRGRRSGWTVHPLLEPEWIAPAAWLGRVEPVQTYLDGRSRYGGPHPAFDDAVYLATTPPEAGASAHRGGPLGHFLRHHTEDDPLPVPAGTSPLTLRQLRARLVEVDTLVRRQERLDGVRPTASWDWAADAAYVAKWAAVPVAGAGDRAAGEAGGPTVSVVLPVRDRPEHVAAAIASVQAQTFADWELLVVDDGSTDRTPHVVAALAEQDPRIRLLRIEHSGASVARNAGLAAARARYVAFLDSDNVWVPHFLQVALAAMTTDGLRAAYAVVEMRRPTGSRYLTYEGGRAALEFANHIDLNVFVAELALIHQVGDFDPALRRMIDWDLVLRVAAVVEPVLLPFVGVHYVDDSSVADRISVREPTSWGEVVLAANLVDWAAQRAGLADRLATRTSVVVSVQDEWQHAVALAAGALTEDGAALATDVEVVLVDRASRPAVSRLLAARFASDPRVRVHRQPRDGRVALAWCEGLAHTTGGVVALVDARCTVRASGAPLHGPWWVPLREALDDPSVSAVAPLVLGPTGTIVSAGLGTRGPGTTPYPLFVDSAPEDVVNSGPLPVGLLGDDALVARAADLIAAHGPDPWYVHGLWGADLSARLAHGSGRLLVVPAVRLVRTREGDAITAGEVGELLARVGDRLPGADSWDETNVWDRVGLEVCDLTKDHGALARPVLTKPRRTVESGPGGGLPALRWAIKIAAPSSEQGDTWGDVHFAADLATALERLGQHVAVDRYPAHARSTVGLDDVVVTLRGLANPSLRREQINVLWVISHPDEVTPAEVRGYDLAYAASLPWAAAMTQRAGVPVEPLLQATDPARFHPGLAEPDTGPAALFVGNSRGVERPVVRDAIAAGVDLTVYGTRWRDFIDLRYVRGDYLPNETVGAAYRAAGVLLNDHWEDMAEQGFMSNRLFDAVAAGARVISDPVAGIVSTFAGAVLEYRTPDELARWIGPERDAVFPSQAELLEISATVRRDHSFDARAVKLVNAVTAELLERSASIAG